MNYDVTPREACLIFSNLLDLSKNTMVGPYPEELFLGGSKVQCYETLRICSLSMGVPTPLNVIVGEKINDPTFLQKFSDGRVQAVLKRDYSMKGQHVFFTKDPNTTSSVKKALREEEKTWNQVEGMFGKLQWFLQPIVAHLLHVGEVRCFIAGGRLVYKVTTTPQDGRIDSPMQVTNYDLIRPLHTHV